MYWVSIYGYKYGSHNTLTNRIIILKKFYVTLLVTGVQLYIVSVQSERVRGEK